MIWIQIFFYIFLGLLLTNILSIPYHELITGLLALILGIVQLFDNLRR